MKNTKIVALVAAAALLVLGTAFASFAASYNWYEQDGEWRCADKNGDDYYDAWAKSGDGWYWLNDEGWMARSASVDEDTKYVDETGRMVTNKWVKLSDEEGNEWWSYYQAGGKKLCGKETGPKPVTVGDNKYVFNVDGKMLSGWILADYADPKEDDYAWQEGVYYCGGEDDGAVKYGWQLIECFNEKEDFVDNNYWFHFGANGKKYAAAPGAELVQKTINGKTYAFDEYGVMKAEWEPVYATEAEYAGNISSYAWFQSVEIGAKFANGWFKVVPQGDVDKDNNTDDTSKWFYAKGGKLAYGEIKSINGKKYGFNDLGEMVSGLVVAVASDYEDKIDFIGIDGDNFGSIVDTMDENYIYFFSNDEDQDGAMKTGAQTVDVDGDAYSFYFVTKGTLKGTGLTGKQGNKYYNNGKKVAADDSIADYMFFQKVEEKEAVKIDTPFSAYDAIKASGKGYAYVDANTNALISKTGAVQTSGTKNDANGYRIKYCKTVEGYEGPQWYVYAE